MFRLRAIMQCAGATLGLVVSASLLVACALPGSVRPTIKIGLSAPFEGAHRDVGYEALYAVRLAVQQRNKDGGVNDQYLVELVALNDFNDPNEAVVQARKMAVDSHVMGVLGGWVARTAQVSAAEYERLGLAFLSPSAELVGTHQQPAEDGFVAGFQALSGGVPPGPVATWAFAEANRLLDALEMATQAEGQPTRTGVREVLTGW